MGILTIFICFNKSLSKIKRTWNEMRHQKIFFREVIKKEAIKKKSYQFLISNFFSFSHSLTQRSFGFLMSRIRALNAVPDEPEL